MQHFPRNLADRFVDENHSHASRQQGIATLMDWAEILGDKASSLLLHLEASPGPEECM